VVWHHALPLMNSFNKTEAAVFSCRLCFLRAFPFISSIKLSFKLHLLGNIVSLLFFFLFWLKWQTTDVPFQFFLNRLKQKNLRDNICVKGPTGHTLKMTANIQIGRPKTYVVITSQKDIF